MHGSIINRMDFYITISLKSPLLIGEGRYRKVKDAKDKMCIQVDPYEIPGPADPDAFAAIPDAIPVCRNDSRDILGLIQDALTGRGGSEGLASAMAGKLKYYIPGASLRGALRAYAERIFRTLSPSEDELLCCDPFAVNKERRDRFCGKALEKEEGRNVYEKQCPVCRLFGSTRVASHIRVEDAYPDPNKPGRVVIRDGIALDRFTGAIAKGPFRVLLLEDFVFKGRISLLNYEYWQPGLMAYLLRDLSMGRISLGGGKNKGYGRIGAEVTKIRIQGYGANGELPAVLRSIGFRDGPGSEVDPWVAKLLEPCKEEDHPFRRSYCVSNPTIAQENFFWLGLAGAFAEGRKGFLPLDHRPSPADSVAPQ
ncbi:MAG: RAMP superfamily CRISPR-associated protein [Desulfatiglandales bacterium]